MKKKKYITRLTKPLFKPYFIDVLIWPQENHKKTRPRFLLTIKMRCSEKPHRLHPCDALALKQTCYFLTHFEHFSRLLRLKQQRQRKSFFCKKWTNFATMSL